MRLDNLSELELRTSITETLESRNESIEIQSSQLAKFNLLFVWHFWSPLQVFVPWIMHDKRSCERLFVLCIGEHFEQEANQLLRKLILNSPEHEFFHEGRVLELREGAFKNIILERHE